MQPSGSDASPVPGLKALVDESIGAIDAAELNTIPIGA